MVGFQKQKRKEKHKRKICEKKCLHNYYLSRAINQSVKIKSKLFNLSFVRVLCHTCQFNLWHYVIASVKKIKILLLFFLEISDDSQSSLM